jgi:23S rRNA pseudouridine1911/1915/1917 synthase
MISPSLPIIAEGQRWVAINKPAGIGVEQHFDYDTVEKRALAQFQRSGATKAPYVGIVHRLDRPVSGALLLARNKSTLVALNQLFAERKVEKTYWALVKETPPKESGRLRHWLLRDQFGKKAIASKRPIPNAKEANLDYQVVRNTEKGCLLEIKPITGKFHQIRVQLATAGFPIVGDSHYGSDRPFSPNCIALHARELSFPDPATGKTVKITADLPASWEIELG